MGNCLQPSATQPFELQLPSSDSAYVPFPQSQRVSLASGLVESSATGQSRDNLRKSLGSLGQQLEEGRNWQEGSTHAEKFSRVFAQTRKLEAKIEKLQRCSVNPSHHKPEKGYLVLERELQQYMSAIVEEMGEVKADVAGLELHLQGLKSSRSLTQAS